MLLNEIEQLTVIWRSRFAWQCEMKFIKFDSRGILRRKRGSVCWCAFRTGRSDVTRRKATIVNYRFLSFSHRHNFPNYISSLSKKWSFFLSCSRKIGLTQYNFFFFLFVFCCSFLSLFPFVIMFSQRYGLKAQWNYGKEKYNEGLHIFCDS